MVVRRKAKQFEVILEPEDEGGYHIYCPLLKGCHSFGDTREEALKNVIEAIQLWLESAGELGMEIPERETVSIQAT